MNVHLLDDVTFVHNKPFLDLITSSGGASLVVATLRITTLRARYHGVSEAALGSLLGLEIATNTERFEATQRRRRIMSCDCTRLVRSINSTQQENRITPSRRDWEVILESLQGWRSTAS